MKNNTEKKHSILWLTSSYPRFKDDSASIFLKYLARGINHSVFDLHILSPDHHKIEKTQHSSSITHHFFKYFFPRNLQKLAYGSGILPNLKANPFLFILVPFFLVSQFLSAFLLVIKVKPSIIHAHWIFPQGTIASIIGKLFNIPVIITAHGGDAFALKGSLLTKIKHWSINHCTSWTSNTKATAQALGDEIKKTIVIPMGVDYKKFSSGTSKTLRTDIPKSTFILLFVGRLVQKKGVNDLLTAYSLLSNKNRNNTQLWIIGDGNERSSLEELSISLNIEKSVTFWGKLPNKQLANFYTAADIFIAPSIADSSGDTEGQGIMLLEAMASGTAIITTKTGGITEVVNHNETGYIVPPKSPKKIKNAIQLLINNRSKRDSLCMHAQHQAQHYDWKKIADTYNQLYQKTLSVFDDYKTVKCGKYYSSKAPFIKK